MVECNLKFYICPKQIQTMKKITLPFLMLLSFATFAQRSAPVSNFVSVADFSNENFRAITDTLFPLSFTTAMTCTLTVYSVVGDSGYVVGTNGYGDKEKAQRYDLSSYQLLEGDVTGALIWAGGKSVSSTPGNVVLKVYAVGGTGAPGTLIGTSNPVTMDLIDTTNANGFTYFSFASPAAIPTNGNFFVSMEMSQVTGDTIGLVSTANGCVETTGYSYEKWSDNTWHSFLTAWPLDIDIAVFPIIDHEFGVGVNSINSGINAINIFPNPTTKNINLNYVLACNSSVNIKLMNAAGIEIMNLNEGSLNKGIHNKSIDISNVSNGVYMLSVETLTGKSIQKIVVAQ